VVTPSFRRRFLPWVVLVLAGALVLSGCSGGLTPPAAVVNGTGITQGALSELLREQLTDPRAAAQASGPGGEAFRQDLTRQLLGYLIHLQVVRAYATGHHIRPAPGDVSTGLRLLVRQVGGQATFERVLRQRTLTLAEVRENLSENLLFQRVERDVVTRLGGQAALANQARATQVFTGWLVGELRRGSVQVNPRFGVLDATKGSVAPLDSTQLLTG